MLQNYPIKITKDEDFLSVYIPDFDVNTQGEDFSEAIFMAKDVISLMSSLLQAKGESIPAPSDVYTLELNTPDEVIALVQIDIEGNTQAVKS